jgi:hypothetical protein
VTGDALAAAQAVARAHGVTCDDAVALTGGSNALIHLRPPPIVARVMTSTAALHDDVPLWLSREVAVGEFLGSRGLAVPPADVLPPGPHEHDGLWMTFWRFVEHDPTPSLPSPVALGRSLRRLHDALVDFRDDLAPLSEIRDWLDGLDPSPSLRARLHALTPTVFESALPAQPIHGDASVRNLLRTDTGLLWNDLEDVCFGPVHWDVAGLVADVRAYGASEAYVADFLDAYGALRPEHLAEFIEAHHVYAAIWRAFSA